MSRVQGVDVCERGGSGPAGEIQTRKQIRGITPFQDRLLPRKGNQQNGNLQLYNSFHIIGPLIGTEEPRLLYQANTLPA